MVDEADVLNGYKWILGRVPAPEEIAAQCSHYDNVAFGGMELFRASLLTSEEFRQGRIAAHQYMRVAPVDLFRPKLVFCHIEKCGGTTMRTMLMSQFDRHRVCPERFNGLADWTANELSEYDLFAGHFDLTGCDVIPGRRKLTMTMLREPKARLLSLFHFWRLHPSRSSSANATLVDLACNCTAHAFFSHPSVIRHPSIRDAMTGQLTRTGGTATIINSFPMLRDDDPIIANPNGCFESAMANLSSLSSFGLVEQYEPSRRLLNHQLGLQMPSIEPQQVLKTLIASASGKTAAAKAEPDDALDRLLDALTRIDQAMYRRAAALFHERVAMLN